LIVAVGGITPNSNRHTLRFLWFALKSLRQAKRTPGCVHASIFRDGDVYFALSVWNSTEAMQAYGASAGHSDAIRNTRGIVRSAINHSYQAKSRPSRDSAIAAWRKATT